MIQAPATAKLVSLTTILPYDDLAGQMAANVPPTPPSQVAARVLALRRKRDTLLPAELFGEPAWDMLLDLFVQQSQGRRVSITSLCLASAAPQTTALRSIGLMEAAGLIERAHSPSDHRVVWLTIVSDVFVMLGEYMKEATTMTGG